MAFDALVRETASQAEIILNLTNATSANLLPTLMAAYKGADSRVATVTSLVEAKTRAVSAAVAAAEKARDMCERADREADALAMTGGGGGDKGVLKVEAAKAKSIRCR